MQNRFWGMWEAGFGVVWDNVICTCRAAVKKASKSLIEGDGEAARAEERSIGLCQSGKEFPRQKDDQEQNGQYIVARTECCDLFILASASHMAAVGNPLIVRRATRHKSSQDVNMFVSYLF